MKSPLLEPGQIIIWIRTCRGLVGGEGTSRVHVMAILIVNSNNNKKQLQLTAVLFINIGLMENVHN